MSKLKNITGDKFGRLTALQSCGSDKHGQALWKCKCECGNEIIARGCDLRRGNTTSCGCKRTEHIKYKDLNGIRFGRLYVIERLRSNNNGKSVFKCKCDCGNIVEVTGGSLTSGRTNSCGCYENDINTKRMTIHGMSNSRLYTIWSNMKARCYREKSDNYKFYGGRGISVCEEWRNSFEKFMGWAMQNGYSSDLTIDRIDVNGNYEPNNCRWATWEIQFQNKRKK